MSKLKFTQEQVLTNKLLRRKVKNRQPVKAKIKVLKQRQAWNKFLAN